MQLIELLQKNLYTISFASSASKSEMSYPLEKLKINTYNIEINDSNFDDLVLKINPEFVIFDRFISEEQFGWRISETCPKAIKILDTEDLHFLRNARQMAFKDSNELSLKYLISDKTKREIASIFRCDLSLIISKYELDLLIDTFKIDKNILFYLPFLLDKIDITKFSNYPSFQERKNFMTIGNFKHEPNKNGVFFLKEKIWPIIHSKLPEAKLNIYGAYMPESIKQLHNEKEGFLIKGWAKNKEKVFTNSRICLAPLIFGAGLKGKLVDGMDYGTPSITTNIGAEAMHDDLDWNGFIVDDLKEFAMRSVELYTNEELWKKAQENGISIINQCFNKTNHGKALISKINTIFNNLEDHRLQNFIGTLLQHHSLQSTKHLSKWIELKNKKSN
ncbi:Glutamate synthase [NADPH] large chain [hydrothermal vent metagenome]|uniref:Glutamate synthase [NADPH] large chain n=1 Tax=hydrothermal vent metagenome TaxID=652676 RepID=A0A3B0TTR1_9ZZZZ